MAIIKEVRGFRPEIHKSCFLAENAVITGDVVIGADSGIWFNAVIRGDVNSIRIGERVNIQDNATIHCTYERHSTTIGNDVSIGHNAIIHGCTLESEVIIGMGAMVLDGAVVPRHTMVAAGGLVPEGKVLESGFLYMGVPVKKIKPLTEDQLQFFIKRTAANYIKYASWYSK